MDFNREAYLNRIGIGDAVSLTETDFEAIHRAQTYNRAPRKMTRLA